MRNIKRRKRILKLLEKIWRANNDLRFCQLIQNCFSNNDIYYVEDKMFEKRIKEYYEKEEKNNKI